jgi:hypothetical protein
MANLTWPLQDRAFMPLNYSEGLETFTQFSTARAGNISTREMPGARWRTTLAFGKSGQEGEAGRDRLQAMLYRLDGGANRLVLPNLVRLMPRGTLRGSPIVGADADAGSDVLSLTDCNGSLHVGDLIGLAGQRLTVLEHAEPPGGDDSMLVQVRPRLRAAAAAGTPVVWNAPTSIYIPTEQSLSFLYEPARVRDGFAIELLEIWQ